MASTAVAALSSLALLVRMFRKDQTYFVSDPYEREDKDPADVLVAYYSRSGNTQAMAREIARRFGADLIEIRAPAYTLDMAGWANAVYDSWHKLPALAEPKALETGAYRLIFLGAPIWWYRPAPPLWTVAGNCDFRSKAVVLFNTFNSRFKPEEIDAFRTLIESKGGKLIDHIHVKRGRILDQISGSELIEEVRELLDARADKWLVSANSTNARASQGKSSRPRKMSRC